MDEAIVGAPDGLVVVARHQTQGRGRRGRVWDSKPGSSLLFSVLFRFQAANSLISVTQSQSIHKYGQAMGLAVVDACDVVGDFKATLKWPNDVLVGTRKLAGVLTETSTMGDQSAVVVGCGLNLNWGGELSEALSSSAISADEAAGTSLNTDAMLSAILRALHERLTHSAWLADAYKMRCSTIGLHVRVEQMDREITGIAVDIDDLGGLVIETDAGNRETVTMGDVVHLRSSKT